MTYLQRCNSINCDSQKLTEDTYQTKLSRKGNISSLQFRNRDENLILTLGKKEFSHHEHGHVFAENGGQWVSSRMT